MEINFTKRNGTELHCRFCNMKSKDCDLFETKPVSGIVCKHCKKHLEDYSTRNPGEMKMRKFKKMPEKCREKMFILNEIGHSSRELGMYIAYKERQLWTCLD